MTERIVGLTGYKGSGKGAAAEVFARAGYEVVKMAGPLKAMLRAFYRFQGVDAETIERKIEGDLKEQPCPYLNGKTPRYAMQTLGTEWGRDLIDAGLWSGAWARAARHHIDNGRGVVCDDVRFDNECSTIKAAGGEVYRVDRGGAGRRDAHDSEAHIAALPVDGVIDNGGTLEDLAGEVGKLLARGIDPDTLTQTTCPLEDLA